MENLKKEYRDLEQRVIRVLREKVENSNYISSHNNTQKAIRVNVFDYKELTISNDKLTFMDENGYQFSLFGDCTLEDLIDIIDIN
jgi:hypothetical protein